MRGDLKNTQGNKVHTGKLIAQAGHAFCGALNQAMLGPYEEVKARIEKIQKHGDIEGYPCDSYFIAGNEVKFNSALDEWMRNSFAKVTLKVNSEEELLEVYNAALEAGLNVVLITDNGTTEFGGVKTNTCIGIGPDFVVS